MLRGRVLRATLPKGSVGSLSVTRAYSVHPGQPSARGSSRRLFWFALTTASAGIGYWAGAKYPPPAIPFVFSPYSTEVRNLSQEAKNEHTREIEKGLHEIPLVKELAQVSYETKSARGVRESFAIAQPAETVPENEAEYLIVRPFVHSPPERLARQFTAGSLRGPGMFATTPLVFSKTKLGAQKRGGREGDTIAFVHIGKNMCGFEGVVHGGLIATMFDEVLARASFYALPSMVGVTAKLEVNYRRPTYADRYFVMESHVTDNSGRKVFTTGEFREANKDTVLATADAVFVEPKFAKYLTWVGGLNVRKLMEE